MNIGVCISLGVSVFISLDKYLEVELVDCMVVLFLVLLRNPHNALHSGCINLNSHQHCTSEPFLHIPTISCCFLSFWQVIRNLWDDILLSFWFAFPWWLRMLSIFPCVCWLSVCLHWQMSVQVLCPFINQVWFFFFFCIELYVFLIYFPYQPFIGYITCDYLRPVRGLSFHLVGVFLHCAKVFVSYSSICFCFCFLPWGYIYKKIFQRAHCLCFLLVLWFQVLHLSL